jgi:hypothetical protein
MAGRWPCAIVMLNGHHRLPSAHCGIGMCEGGLRYSVAWACVRVYEPLPWPFHPVEVRFDGPA